MPVARFTFASVALLSQFALSACATTHAVGTAADVPRLAIMSAFEPELVKLRAATAITGTRVINEIGRAHV